MRKKVQLLASVALAVLLASGMATISEAAAGDTTRVSVDSSGAQGNGSSSSMVGIPSISADGRFVTFYSEATNLVAGDTNGATDYFVRDLQNGTTERVSVDSSGAQAITENPSRFDFWGASISSDGRFVAFESRATNLVPGDTNGTYDVFVHEFEPDTTAPRVVRTVPDTGATGVSRGIVVKATFSERVYNVKANFKLYRKGSSIPVAAVVTPVADTNNRMWVLDPDSSLRAGTIYIAKVLSSVQDKVGHNLDQNTTMGGEQPMRWTFKTKS